MDFKQYKNNSNKLISDILVENLLLENPNIFAIGVQMSTESDKKFFDRQDGYLDERRILWSQCCYIDDLIKESETCPGFHLGDCTGVPASCSRCLAESLYSSAKKIIKEYRELIVDIKSESISERETTIDLLAILLAGEPIWDQYIHAFECITYGGLLDKNELTELEQKQYDQYVISKQNIEEQQKIYNELSKKDFSSIKERLINWNSLSDINKKIYKDRAIKFLNYFDIRPDSNKLGLNIPWW